MRFFNAFPLYFSWVPFCTFYALTPVFLAVRSYRVSENLRREFTRRLRCVPFPVQIVISHGKRPKGGLLLGNLPFRGV